MEAKGLPAAREWGTERGVPPDRDSAARAGSLPDGYRYWAFISHGHEDTA